ncbi:hypothetical protein [Aquiflexum gelatinilyticum]|uniref:Uncharacterized protein n=1 Tax=Aquiflexum gelatinilyticum TaxID=2961943 RepID=A0A9X2P562_9BACT|nr:hypothetical protein [Aquiflexum gelatinilyticum]MCR9016286.1 hypothetical protein [Aquiflexum gelatinilyticum]
MKYSDWLSIIAIAVSLISALIAKRANKISKDSYEISKRAEERELKKEERKIILKVWPNSLFRKFKHEEILNFLLFNVQIKNHSAKPIKLKFYKIKLLESDIIIDSTTRKYNISDPYILPEKIIEESKELRLLNNIPYSRLIGLKLNLHAEDTMDNFYKSETWIIKQSDLK